MKNTLLILVVLLLISCSSTIKRNKQFSKDYFFGNSNIKKHERVHKDDNGIPMLEVNNKYTYYPVQYTQIAIDYFKHYKKFDDKISKSYFIKLANFIKDNIVHYENFSVWEFKDDIPGYNEKAPSPSAMAQGFGIVAMLNAYQITNNTDYLRVAESALNAFEFDIEKNGVSNLWGDHIFYEEYADDSHVLNGFIFALGALHYYADIMNNSKAKKLFEIGVNTLKTKIHNYDADFTSYYGKNFLTEYQYASAINEDPDHYHELVIYQLLALYVWTGEDVFYEYAHKFLKYDTGKVTDIFDENKFLEIQSSFTTDSVNYGTNKLNDELWTWDKYWSTHKFPTELVITFPKKEKNISEIVFYSISKDKLPLNFEVYVFNNNSWQYVMNDEDVKSEFLRTYKTRHYLSYIKGISINNPVEGSKIKIKFLPNSKQKTIALREINVHYDRNDVLKKILSDIKTNIEAK